MNRFGDISLAPDPTEILDPRHKEFQLGQRRVKLLRKNCLSDLVDEEHRDKAEEPGSDGGPNVAGGVHMS